MSLIYINKLPADLQESFAKGVKEVARRLGVDPAWLMQVMWSESRLKADAVNPMGGATGLIQFMPVTAKDLGTTTAHLKTLNAVQQLPWVEKYFNTYKGRMKSYYDVYAVTFFPAMIGKPDDWILETKRLPAALIAKQNPAINKDKNGAITVGEFKAYVKSTVPGIYQKIVFAAEDLAQLVVKKK